MTDHSPESPETILTDTSSAAHLQAEIDEMRRRLTALEARTRTSANQTVVRKRHWRATPKRLALMIVGVMLAGATIVFGQNAVDALFVSKDGKVGIGTTSPRNKLSVDGNTDVSGNLSVTGTATTNKLSVTGNADFSGTATSKKLSVAGNGDFSGNVGIGTTSPSAKLDVVGSGWFRNDQNALPASAGKGVRVFYDVLDVGQIYSYDYATSNPKNLILQSPGGNVGIGTTTPQTKLDVAGNMRVGTIVSQARYQLDSQTEMTYTLSPRYHVSLTGGAFDGGTKLIPQEVINDLCGDSDGCEYRIGMTRWANDTLTETASRMGLFYYSTSDGRWRSSEDQAGVDGNRITEHVKEIWDTCYFTDAPYYQRTGQRDDTRGMYLLVWTASPNRNRTCELTLID